VRRGLRFCVFALLLAGALVAVGTREGATANSRKLYVVPLGNFPRSSLDELRHYAQQRFGFASTLLPDLTPPGRTFDRGRRQFIAERLIGFVEAKERSKIKSQRSLVLIFTAEDIYSSRRSGLRYVFTNRAASTYAVISIRRMNPTFFGLPADRRLLQRRLHKIIARDVGFLLGHPPSFNWRSALYAHLDSLDDLDGMTDEWQPRGGAAESSWVRGANRVCNRAERQTQAVARRTRPARRHRSASSGGPFSVTPRRRSRLRRERWPGYKRSDILREGAHSTSRCCLCFAARFASTNATSLACRGDGARRLSRVGCVRASFSGFA
jgi:predicted Zn-dependent protease